MKYRYRRVVAPVALVACLFSACTVRRGAEADPGALGGRRTDVAVPGEGGVIARRLGRWYKACAAGDPERASEFYLPDDTWAAKDDMAVVGKLVDAELSRLPGFWMAMWDDEKAKVISKEVILSTSEWPVFLEWEMKKSNGRWFLSKPLVAGETRWTYGTLESELSYLKAVFYKDYLKGGMWLDRGGGDAQFVSVELMKERAALLNKREWPDMKDAPEDARQIGALLKKWRAACLDQDVERLRDFYHSKFRGDIEKEVKKISEVGVELGGRWFIPMLIKLGPTVSEAISYPIDIDMPWVYEEGTMNVSLRKSGDLWRIWSRNMELWPRGKQESCERHLQGGGRIWYDAGAPEWLRPDQETGTDVTLEQIKALYKECEPWDSYVDSVKASFFDRERFEAYFPESSEGARRLEEWWEVRRKPDEWKKENGWAISAAEEVEIVRNGLRNADRQKGEGVLAHAGFAHICEKRPADSAAVDLAYHASFSSDYEYSAARYGLLAVEPKSEKVLKRLAELAIVGEKACNLIIREMKDSQQKEEFVSVLEVYLQGRESELALRAGFVSKAIEGETDPLVAGAWALSHREASLKSQALYGKVLPLVRELMLEGTSNQRRKLFEFLDDERGLYGGFDGSFTEGLLACLEDGCPEVKQGALEIYGFPFVLFHDAESKGAWLEAMDRLSKDPDLEVRMNVARVVADYLSYPADGQEDLDLAVGIEMRLLDYLCDENFHEVRGAAVSGLLHMYNKSEEVVERLVALVRDWQVDIDGLRRGLESGADRETVRKHLEKYVYMKHKGGDRARELYRKIFAEEPPKD